MNRRARTLKRVALLAHLAALSLVCAIPARAAGDVVPVTVDTSSTIGRTNHNLVGVGIHQAVGAGRLGALRPGTVRVDAGIENLVRCPGGTIRRDRLAELQAKLDFAESIGRQTILILSYMPPCLAATYSGDPRTPSRLPPRDPEVWRRLIIRLVTATGPKRVAAGRRPVRYYEVWNEPDFPVFWQATMAEFIAGVMVPSGRAVAAVEAASGLDLRFGLCACVVPDPIWLGSLMEASRAAGTPVDFLSWHYYANYPCLGPDGAEAGGPEFVYPLLGPLRCRNPLLTPEVYAGQIELVRELARARLGRVPELVIDEWNLAGGGFDRRHDTNEGAAFQAATLAVFAREGLDRAVIFKSVDDDIDRDAEGRPLPHRYGGWGLLDRSLRRKPAWHTQWYWRRLGPTRLASPHYPDEGVWTAAASEGPRVQVLVASFEAEDAINRSLSLRLVGVAPGRYRVRLYRIDARHRGSTRPTRTVLIRVGTRGRARLDTALPTQSVVLAELSRRAP